LKANDRRYLRAWLIGAATWGYAGLLLLLELAYQSHRESITDLWLALSLLWGQFAFAGLFGCVRNQRWKRLPAMVLVAILPPASLYVAISALLQ
jgi:hypothetical protein